MVTASDDDSEDMQSGTYDVEDEDLPLKQIYQCEAKDLTRICIRDLAEDEKNGRLGYHPLRIPFSRRILSCPARKTYWLLHQANFC